jgi:membrane protein implicated in regulation of membrane protease activity
MFDTLHYWHWWVIGVALIALELSISGAYFFLWLGASAGLVGFLAAIPGFGWEAQLFAFAALSIVSVFLWRRFGPEERESDQPALNKRGHRYIGGLFTLNQPIVNGVGKLIVADTTWKVTGADMPAGIQVTVTRVDGVALHVERASGSTESAARG